MWITLNNDYTFDPSKYKRFYKSEYPIVINGKRGYTIEADKEIVFFSNEEDGKPVIRDEAFKKLLTILENVK